MSNITRSLKREIVHKRGKFCCFCGIRTTNRAPANTALTIDHRIPRSKGGTDDPENLKIACLLCNNGRGDLDFEVYVTLVRQHGRERAASIADAMRSVRDKAAAARRTPAKIPLDMT